MCGKLKYSTQKTQNKQDTLMDPRKRGKMHSKKIVKIPPHSSVIRGAWDGRNCV